MFRKKSILFLVVLVPLFILPLILSTSSAITKGVASGKGEFGDLTEKEHCISNLMLSYTKRDIEKFSDLLHEDYIYWVGKAKKWNAQKECEMTTQLFKSPELSIEIESGSWTLINEIFGSPCKKCWETTRKYTITSQVSENGNTYTGSGYTKYIITQVEEKGKSKYKILAIIDLGKEPSK